ncbi:MAG: hypothetical protein ACI4S4_02405 [Candidatus Ornithospirochaeta sp.]
MKKSLCVLMLFFILVFTVSAETAFWTGPDSPVLPLDNSQYSAYTDLYEVGSEISITSSSSTIIAKVEGRCPESTGGRDLALTRSALEELGLWGEGHSTVSVRLRKGAVKEGEEKTEDTGWFAIVLAPVSPDKASDIYKVLVRKGFKPRSEKNGERDIVFTLPYIVDYEREEKKEVLLAMVLSVTAEEPSANPYET